MSVNMFDILGPITVGPSSSHTAGAIRIGLACRIILGEDVKKAKVTFYGSFADTYRGHGTDKAVIGGLLGFNTDNVKVRDSLQLAQLRGMEYELTTAEEPRFHPNTVRIEAQGALKSVNLRGVSVGGGAIRLVELNGFAIDAACLYDTLVVFHQDAPGTLAGMAQTLSGCGYNIGNLRLSRDRRDGNVITIIETDVPVDPKTVAALSQVHNLKSGVSIPKF